MTNKGKVLLAYSGGLDTSCILAWLIEEGYEVMAYMADVGQEEDFVAAKEKALKVGATKVFIEDLKKEFVQDVVFPAIQANAIYEDLYLLGTSLARPVIAKHQIRIAKENNCEFVSHGCTGKGNDQVRFELAFYALQPSIKVIAPWRQEKFCQRFQGRSDLLKYAAEKGIPVSQTPSKPWSTDENLFHISYEAGILEDPNTTPPTDMWKMTQSIEDAPDAPEHITLEFSRGIPTKVVNEADNTSITDSLELFMYLNRLGCKHGVGRIDIVENRFIGIKSRGCYETPGGTILHKAHIDLEGLTMDREVRCFRDRSLKPQISDLLYKGFYFSPEWEVMMPSLLATQKTITGMVRLKLYKGNVTVVGRKSDTIKLYSEEESSMDIHGSFTPMDSEGFIKIQSIRVKKWMDHRMK